MKWHYLEVLNRENIVFSCLDSWQDLHTETSHDIGSFPIFLLEYFKWCTSVATDPQYTQHQLSLFNTTYLFLFHSSDLR